MAQIIIANPIEQERLRMADVLSAEGHNCLLCADGGAVRSVLEKTLPDLVLTDVDLPGLDAFEMVRLLEKVSEGKGVPLIVGHSESKVSQTEETGAAFAWLGLSARSEDLVSMVKARLSAGPTIQGKYRILVIEDDWGLRSLLAKRLTLTGYDVITAQDGEEGLLQLKLGVDLVLTDVDMPRLDGLGFLRRMRTEIAYRDLPVIVMTAQAGRAEDAAQGLALGANDYVRKPFDWRELQARVETQLRVRNGYRLMAEKQRDLAIIELAGAAAHEINNPLSVIMARLELMKDRMGPANAYYNDVVTLSSMVERIANIVQKLGQVRRYQVQHYCGGVNILDLDSSSEK